ncbi:hypothetical protein [Chromobacterium sp. IIBBL 290-4]|uniref:hypothetical protein n=1 Tax=Chromobacterium sp. IIBBL 290-4 TaxID=2953890 RepID=UPI0020B6831C|nr:hypothetical protein [Chromobacterium sp. IIBBL 290-4]UTH74363.1 hypothetical protein NKT35_22955 [Chromobacterium sp. IIBBL 290-4]
MMSAFAANFVEGGSIVANGRSCSPDCILNNLTGLCRTKTSHFPLRKAHFRQVFHGLEQRGEIGGGQA